MRRKGAYRADMTRLPRQDALELDDLRFGGGDEELARFVGELRTIYLQPISRDVESAHIQSMVAEAGDLRSQYALASSSGRRRRFRLALQLAAAAMGALFITGGLAIAGVDLPAALDDALSKLGGDAPEHVESLPASTTPSDAGEISTPQRATVADALLSYIATTAAQGCDFGQAVAGIATQGTGGHSDACQAGPGASGSGGGQQNSGGAGAQGGKATGEQNSSGAAGGDAVDGNPTVGPERSGEHAGDAGSQADDPAQGGKETGDETSGGATEDAGPPADITPGSPNN
jgi:hypothetical protein